jgi:sugar-specific transcriptional regulator TrmB
MTMEETDALGALERLGLTSYEARMLVGLQKLGPATASEVARATDVPRSQVYGTADSLEEKGLVEVQNASPTRFRPVDPEAAVDLLYERLDRERRRATDYLREVEGSLAGEADEHRPDIWVTRGADNVTRRVEELVDDATERVVVGASDPAQLSPTLVAALESRVEAGVDVLAISEDDATLDRLHEVAGARVATVREERSPETDSSRLLVVDGRTVLIGMSEDDDAGREAAMWSENTRFAAMLARLIEAQVERMTDDYPVA